MASRYTAAFRAEAVKLVLEQHLNVPQAAKQLAMPKQTLDKWVKLAQQGKLAGLDQHRVQPVDELSAEVASGNCQTSCRLNRLIFMPFFALLFSLQHPSPLPVIFLD
ncbi:transposase [Iodobacter sp. BJB302]|uniref:transposase n=1 Tax=Iodobacter sp. BJB302 TaxID=1506510 RepID=UPI000C0D658E|nr:helix-turn-helix domain-containing protein [Iodobacter sp. BJB302]PHU99897.1 hypothetical protein CSQ88_19985 [Iodobacter sp. BJB302]